jgi:hypothetical protein
VRCIFRRSLFVKLTYILSAIANQESLSGLETEMRKLEGLVKEVVDEMNYLKKREERFTNTNCASPQAYLFSTDFLIPDYAQFQQISVFKTSRGSLFFPSRVSVHGKSYISDLSLKESTSLIRPCIFLSNTLAGSFGCFVCC